MTIPTSGEAAGRRGQPPRWAPIGRLPHTGGVMTLLHHWAVLAVLASASASLTNYVTKRYVEHLDEYMLAWAKYLFSLPALWVAVIAAGLPVADSRFWGLTLAIVPVEIAIGVLLAKAIKLTPISVLTPLG